MNSYISTHNNNNDDPNELYHNNKFFLSALYTSFEYTFTASAMYPFFMNNTSRVAKFECWEMIWVYIRGMQYLQICGNRQLLCVMATRGIQWQYVAICGNEWQYVAMVSCSEWQYVAFSGNSGNKWKCVIRGNGDRVFSVVGPRSSNSLLYMFALPNQCTLLDNF